jgi:hypothetical protein
MEIGDNMRQSITRFLERQERGISRAFAGFFFGAGLFELMCAHARFVISGASQLPSDTLPMVTGSSYPMNHPLVMLGCATSVLGYYMYAKYWVN